MPKMQSLDDVSEWRCLEGAKRLRAARRRYDFHRRLAVHLAGEERAFFDHMDGGGTCAEYAAASGQSPAATRQRYSRLLQRLSSLDHMLAAEILDDLPPDLRPLLLEMGLRNRSAREAAVILGRTETWCDRTYRMLRVALRVVLRRELLRQSNQPFDG